MEKYNLEILKALGVAERRCYGKVFYNLMCLTWYWKNISIGSRTHKVCVAMFLESRPRVWSRRLAFSERL